MSFAEAAEHARNAAGKADNASLISAGLFDFREVGPPPRDSNDERRAAFETLCFAVGELSKAVGKLAEAQSKQR